MIFSSEICVTAPPSARYISCKHISTSTDFLVASEWCVVLGLARTGLIFTRLQEGAQPGGGG